MNHDTSRPRLLKARQLHTRIFAVLLLVLVAVTAPQLDSSSVLRFVMRWVGYLLVIVGTFGRIYTSVFIGGKKNDVVVRDGMFAVVRNPLYVFSFIAVAGIGLQSGMLTILVLLLGAFCLYYPKVVAREEAFLLHRFGEEYAAYMREVPRWLPRLSLWKETGQVEINPKFIRNALKDALVFFLPLPFFVVVSVLHTHDILPVWLILP
jgi:protein-S-isoprenylcysteine O-methyltransferase Ste14